MRISDWSSDVCSSDLKAELDEKLTNIDVAKRTINIREAQAAGEERRKDAELLLKRHDTLEGIKLKTAEQARKDRETDNRIDIGLAELDLAIDAAAEAGRSDKRRVGNECVRTCRTRWLPKHEKKKITS